MTIRLLPALCAVSIALAGCGKQDAADSGTSENETSVPVAPVAPTAAMGEQIFKRCAACHTIAKGGPNGIGPNLHAVVGRAVAGVDGYAYSSAMKSKGGIWDKATLDVYLKQPMMAVPGTKMAFAGIPDDADRAALILYLAAQRD